MSTSDQSAVKDPTFLGALAALHRAAEFARQNAIQTNTDRIIAEDGKLSRICASELRFQAQKRQPPVE